MRRTGHGPDDVRQDLIERKAHRLARLFSGPWAPTTAHRERFQRYRRPSWIISVRMAASWASMRRPLAISSKGEVDEHHLHDDRRATYHGDIQYRDTGKHTRQQRTQVTHQGGLRGRWRRRFAAPFPSAPQRKSRPLSSPSRQREQGAYHTRQRTQRENPPSQALKVILTVITVPSSRLGHGPPKSRTNRNSHVSPVDRNPRRDRRGRSRQAAQPRRVKRKNQRGLPERCATRARPTPRTRGLFRHLLPNHLM